MRPAGDNSECQTWHITREAVIDISKSVFMNIS